MTTTGWDSEIQRLAAVRALRLLDTPREERFDRITRLAQRLLNVPIALVTLVDADRQWFKSCMGLDADETARSVSFCSHAVAAQQLLEVPDATEDPRFADNPYVVGDPYIRFYAGQPVAAPSGALVGTLCVVDRVPRTLTDDERSMLLDLAAWVELECTVVQATQWETARRDFVSMVSHEMRTPLTSVRSSLEMVCTGEFGRLPPQVDKLLDIAARNSDRLIRLCTDVLDLHNMGRGELRLRLDKVALPEVIDQAVHAVGHASHEAGVPVVVTSPESLYLRGDADRLAQVIINLLANAIRFSACGDVVEVDCEPLGKWASINIRDHGPGIPPDRLEAIFEPFVQFEVADQRRAGGAGLGLAITRGIVEAHGGSIHAFAAEGGGAIFEILIPANGPQDEDRPWW
ncbi:GAF domain-containing sensor histidine kinase [Actinokineospora enzanensis]|uniref:GAF domain-containing sensor histidine kinase n=1 Tax=Actinokineospora enzanensis TaxID=155975 RepID=UPI000362B364|nr:GAF domain-containing sensor histidine kinase [Actinokineospora enzanensis]